MSKKKPLVEDMSVDIKASDNQGPVDVKIEDPTSLPGGQDPTRNPDTVEGSVFPQIPGEAGDASKAPENEPEDEEDELEDTGETPEPERSQGFALDEIIEALDELFKEYPGSKIELFQAIERLMKEHKSRM